MSGHSKWSSIKHQKGVADVRRGKLFTKLTKEIIMAAREGGGNPDMNARLRLAIQHAKDSNMPSDNIERGIKRGEGTLDGMVLIEMTLEGYGPGGAAVLVEAVTDNRNRTVQEVRNIFNKGGGSMGENGSVTWLFYSRGLITVETEENNADEIELAAIDAGAEDVSAEDGLVEIYTKPEDMEKVRKTLEENDIKVCSAEVAKIAKNTLELDHSKASQMMKMLEKLEDLDETQNVCTNVDFPDDILENQG